MAIKSVPHTFSVKKPLKYTYSYKLFQNFSGCQTILYLVTVIINYLVKHCFFSEKFHFSFSQDPVHCTTYSKGGWGIYIQHCYFGLILQSI